MGKFKGIVKVVKAGLKAVGATMPALVSLLGMSLMCVSCSVVTPQENIYKSYRDTEAFKEVYMEDVSAATEAFKEGYITNEEYQKRMDKYDSDNYLKEKIMADTEHPEYREALEKMNDGFTYLAVGGPMMFVAGIGSAVFYASGAGKSVYKSVGRDIADAKNEFKKSSSGSGPKPKPKKPIKSKKIDAADEEELQSIDEYYQD